MKAAVFTSGKQFRILAGKKNPLISAAYLVLLLVAGMALFGPMVAPHDPLRTDLSLRLHPPSWQYPFGNDALGRCLLSRILYGAPISVGLATAVVGFTALFGTGIGLLAGYRGGKLDVLFMRVVDLFFAFPEIIVALAVAGVWGPGTWNLLLALSAVGWMRYARVVRGITLSVKEREFVQAARLAGLSRRAIILRYILPANLPAVVVLATIGLAKALLAVSALGFLGFGVQPPQPEWGTLLMEGKDYLLSAPHLSLYPGLILMLTVLSLNIVGDHLGDRE